MHGLSEYKQYKHCEAWWHESGVEKAENGSENDCCLRITKERCNVFPTNANKLETVALKTNGSS